MDFYLDENMPHSIAEALDILERHEGRNRVFSTENVFGKEVKDIPLFKKIKEVKGVLITFDIKMKTRRNEFAAIKDLGMTVVLLSVPGGANYKIIKNYVFDKWDSIIDALMENKGKPGIFRVTKDGKPKVIDALQ